MMSDLEWTKLTASIKEEVVVTVFSCDQWRARGMEPKIKSQWGLYLYQKYIDD